MKELLFKQFEKEVKEVRKDKVEVIVEGIDSLIESVNENNLKMSVLNIKINFDNMIMDGQDYKQKDSIREELFTKYTNVETFKNGLLQFKQALQNVNKTKPSKSEKVESKASFTETVIEEKQQKVPVDKEVKIILEDGPISDKMMQLLDEVKNCIGTELFTEDNFKERVSKLHGTGLLTRLFMENGHFKSDIINSFGVEDITDEDIEGFFSSFLGLKLLLKELNPEIMNYIIVLINDIEESKKEEVSVDSNTTFTNTVVVENTNTVQQPIVSESSNNKSLMEQVIQKCNQEAGTISRDLMEAEQVLRNNQVATNVVNDVVVDNMNVVVQEAVKDTVEESVKPDNKKVGVKQEKQQTKSKDMCKYEDCTNKKHTRGYCYKHYKELKEQGIIGGGNNNAK